LCVQGPPNDGAKDFRFGRVTSFMKSRFYYAGIRVRDLKRSLTFYTKVFGMKVAARGTMPHGGKWVHLVTPGTRMRLELNWYPRGSRFFVPYRRGEEMDHLAFVVDDVKAAYRALLRRGVKVAVDPAHSKGTEVYVKDPDGIWIELLS
jgi:lactoylglutathione lyase